MLKQLFVLKFIVDIAREVDKIYHFLIINIIT